MALYHLYLSVRVPLLYFTVGVLVYYYLEGWQPGDTVYYLIVTSTTVGYVRVPTAKRASRVPAAQARTRKRTADIRCPLHALTQGDFYPASPLGKLFTCVYAILGITVVLGALAPLVAFLQGDWRERLLTCLGCGAGVDTSDMSLSMEEINQRINYPRRYALALLSPLIVLISGMALHYHFIREPPSGDDPIKVWLAEWAASTLGLESLNETLDALGLDFGGLVDSFYWTIITMTTIG